MHILLYIIEYYWILLNIIVHYWILLNIIEYYWIYSQSDTWSSLKLVDWHPCYSGQQDTSRLVNGSLGEISPSPLLLMKAKDRRQPRLVVWGSPDPRIERLILVGLEYVFQQRFLKCNSNEKHWWSWWMWSLTIDIYLPPLGSAQHQPGRSGPDLVHGPNPL